MKWSIGVCCALLGGWSVAAASAQVTNTVASDKTLSLLSEPLPTAQLTLGGRMGDDFGEGLVDVLCPLWKSRNALVFLDPRGAASDDSEQELNLGLGGRILTAREKLILGANVYYDSRWTQFGNHFNQLGVGVELLSRWVDARANTYFPLDDKARVDQFEVTEAGASASSAVRWDEEPSLDGRQIVRKGDYELSQTIIHHTFECYEQARGGWDAEVGLRLPLPIEPVEARVFGGYYSWDGRFDSSQTIAGWKSRVEVRAWSSIFLDGGWNEDRALDGSEWYVGLRVSATFDLGQLWHGSNPFAWAGGPSGGRRLADRMMEMVIRDPKIRMEVSDYEENKSALYVETNVTYQEVRAIIEPNVVFVLQGCGGLHLGTLTDPYARLLQAVDSLRATGGKIFLLGTQYIFDDDIDIGGIPIDLFGVDYRGYDGTRLHFGQFTVLYDGPIPDWLVPVDSSTYQGLAMRPRGLGRIQRRR